MGNVDWGEMLLWYPVLLFSLTFHEAAHAWVAKLGGDLTAYQGGQVSLNPLPHIRREPFGTVAIPLITYYIGGWMIGWASTPFDPMWANRHPRRAAWMSAAGPTANLLLVVVAGLLIRAGMLAGYFSAPASLQWGDLVDAQAGWEAAGLVLSILFSLNLLLCIFNLLPVPPLDGSGAIVLFMNESTARKWNNLISQPMVAWGGILLAWYVLGDLFAPVHFAAVSLLYPEMSYG